MVRPLLSRRAMTRLVVALGAALVVTSVSLVAQAESCVASGSAPGDPVGVRIASDLASTKADPRPIATWNVGDENALVGAAAGTHCAKVVTVATGSVAVWEVLDATPPR